VRLGSVATTAVAAIAVADIRTAGCTVALGTMATRTTTLFAGASQVDDDRASIDGPAVQSADGGLGVLGGSHLDKAEALGTAGLTVRHDLGGGDAAELGKVALQAGIGDGVGEVAYIDLAGHGKAFIHGARARARRLR